VEVRELVIIGNPEAGRARRKDHLKRCAEILTSGGLEVEVWPTERPQHATELATLAGARLVVAAGGDGTINEVVNGLHRDATLGILPFGTANVLARELGLPLKAEAAFKVYSEGDLPTLHIACGDESYTTQFAIVANGHYYGGDFRVSDAVSLANGELEVVLVERVSRLLRPDVFARILAKRPLSRSMRSFSVKELRAVSPGAYAPVQLDGEVWGRLPMSFHIEPNALKLIR
jgi:diacylglycerol kinase family enzyme